MNAITEHKALATNLAAAGASTTNQADLVALLHDSIMNLNQKFDKFKQKTMCSSFVGPTPCVFDDIRA